MGKGPGSPLLGDRISLEYNMAINRERLKEVTWSLTKRTIASWNVLAMMSWMAQRNGRVRVDKRMLTVLTEYRGLECKMGERVLMYLDPRVE
jgi:hypothetical protein